jgi:threonine dehydratase
MRTMETFTCAEDLTEQIWTIHDEVNGTDLKFDKPNFYRTVNHCGDEIIVCDDTANFTSTFKRRGAGFAGRIALLRDGSITEFHTGTAGSHGLGVADSAQNNGIKEVKAIIQMPSYGSPNKISKMNALGATVNNLHTSLAVALSVSKELSEQNGGYFIHPYDQPEVIAGQGTLAWDILRYLDEERIEAPVELLYPIGGGGLFAGNIAAIKKKNPDRPLKVIGVEIEDKINNADLCDGTATTTGELPSLIINDPQHKPEIITVSRKQVAQSMFALQRLLGKEVEGSGAISYAGALLRTAGVKKETILIPVVTGANPSAENMQAAVELVFCGML